MNIITVLADNCAAMRNDLENLLGICHSFQAVAESDCVNLATAYTLSHPTGLLFAQLSIGNPRYSGDGSFMPSYLSAQLPGLLVVPYSENTCDAYRALSLVLHPARNCTRALPAPPSKAERSH